jgi:hypothetical protein
MLKDFLPINLFTHHVAPSVFNVNDVDNIFFSSISKLHKFNLNENSAEVTIIVKLKLPLPAQYVI